MSRGATLPAQVGELEGSGQITATRPFKPDLYQDPIERFPRTAQANLYAILCEFCVKPAIDSKNVPILGG